MKARGTRILAGIRHVQTCVCGLRAKYVDNRADIPAPADVRRRAIVRTLIDSPPVQRAIDREVRKRGTSRFHAIAAAKDLVREIAADQSPAMLRVANRILGRRLTRMYDAIDVHHVNALKTMAPGCGIVYVPCHRSTLDDLLLPFVLYRENLAVPHIGAGANLDLPIVGRLMRKVGTFFLRRTFLDGFYSTVFREYMSQMLAHGIPLAYFIEGGRSRTGRTLAPQTGLLQMTLRGYLRSPERPLVFQPVHIGYERIIEEDAYAREIAGAPKTGESLRGLLRGLRHLHDKQGAVAINFGEPVVLSEVLDRIAPEWRSATGDSDDKPAWLRTATDTIAELILQRINASAVVHPLALLASVVSSAPGQVMAEADLVAQVELTRSLLAALPYSADMDVTPRSAHEIVLRGEESGVLERISHPHGDIVRWTPHRRGALTYLRNGIAHILLPLSWAALLFSNSDRVEKDAVSHLGRALYPFLKAEMHLPWNAAEFEQRVLAILDEYAVRGLIDREAGASAFMRRHGQSNEAFRLSLVAQSAMQLIQRYYIGMAAIARTYPASCEPASIEPLFVLSTQRLALLYDFDATEVFDKSLLTDFVDTLKEQLLVSVDGSGRLECNSSMHALMKDIRMLLPRDVRDAVLKVSPRPLHFPVDDDLPITDRSIGTNYRAPRTA